MTGKDDSTISFTHLMVKLSVLAGGKIILKGGGNHPFCRRGLTYQNIKEEVLIAAYCLPGRINTDV